MHMIVEEVLSAISRNPAIMVAPHHTHHREVAVIAFGRVALVVEIIEFKTRQSLPEIEGGALLSRHAEIPAVRRIEIAAILAAAHAYRSLPGAGHSPGIIDASESLIAGDKRRGIILVKQFVALIKLLTLICAFELKRRGTACGHIKPSAHRGGHIILSYPPHDAHLGRTERHGRIVGRHENHGIDRR